jgi:hypothetical protein
VSNLHGIFQNHPKSKQNLSIAGGHELFLILNLIKLPNMEGKPNLSLRSPTVVIFLYLKYFLFHFFVLLLNKIFRLFIENGLKIDWV